MTVATTASARASAAICFQPDGFQTTGRRVMGRQSAGYAFLRAAIAGRGEDPVCAYTPHRASARAFADLVHRIDGAAKTSWCPADRLDLVARIGTLYVPSPSLAPHAQVRLRAGPASYSLCGITHTIASDRAMAAIADLLTAPVMPWDAVICTSRAASGAVRRILEAQRAYLRWRFGTAIQMAMPQLPMIPLGVHADDFVFSEAERAVARDALGIADDEVAALFAGRLSFHAKAHPEAMYAALQEAASASGRKLVLIQCGWFANRPIEKAFKDGARTMCPAVRCLFTDSKDDQTRRQSWAAADLFVSLSDNIQETFGLTPIEAMAAGLPVVVTDWDGYRDTVRHGRDGFRIPTAMPPPSVIGDRLAASYESGGDDYDGYCGLACQTVAVDRLALTDRLADLVANPELRRRLGASGRARVREAFDWKVVYRRYQELWHELAGIRAAAREHPVWRTRLATARHEAAARQNPFRLFGHYPTFQITAETRVEAMQGASVEAYRALARHPLFRYAARIQPPASLVQRLLGAANGSTVAATAERAGIRVGPATLALAVLGKMGLVRLVAPAAAAAGPQPARASQDAG